MCIGAGRAYGMRKMVRHRMGSDETVTLVELDGILDNVGRGRAGPATYA